LEACRKIGQQTNPEARPRQQSGFLPIEIAIELNGFLGVLFAEARRIEAQKAGEYLLRHIPP
jgi:hypothetical protein